MLCFPLTQALWIPAYAGMTIVSQISHESRYFSQWNTHPEEHNYVVPAPQPVILIMSEPGILVVPQPVILLAPCLVILA